MDDCNNHGDYIDNKCSCDWGWYNENSNSSSSCLVPGSEVWSYTAWQIFQWLFFILHCTLFLISLFKLYTTLNQDKIKSCKRLIHRLFRSPRNLCLMFLACIGLLRAFWLRFDPFSFKGVTDRIGDRLLFETVYPFIYGLYSSVLLVWGGLYQGMRPKDSDPFKILRKIIMALMIIAFPTSIVVSVLKGMRFVTAWMAIAGIFVSIGILAIVLGFLAFGVLLYCYVEKQRNIEASMELSVEEVISEGSEKEENSFGADGRSMSKRLSLVIPKNMHSSKNSNRSWEEFMSDDGIEWKKEEIENFESEETQNVQGKKESVKKMVDGKNFISLITEDDRIIFRKLCSLMMISTILGILVLVFMIFLTNSNKNMSPIQELGMIYGVFILELFACWMIFIVFTAQIKVKDKKNLRYFTLISMKMNKKEPKLRLPPVLKHIKFRLKKFYN